MGRYFHSDETKKEYMRLRAEGWTLQAISDYLGVPFGTISNWNRLPEVPLGHRKYHPHPIWKKEEFRRMYHQDFYQKYIAECLDIPLVTIRAWTKKLRQEENAVAKHDEITERAVNRIVRYFADKGDSVEKIANKLSLPAERVYQALDATKGESDKILIKRVQGMLRNTANLVRTAGSRKEIILELNKIYEFLQEEEDKDD